MSHLLFPCAPAFHDPHRNRNREGGAGSSGALGQSTPAASVTPRPWLTVHRHSSMFLARKIDLVLFLFIVLFAVGSETAMAAAPTVSLVVSGPQIGSIYFAGDTYVLTVYGPVGALVTVSQTRQNLLVPAVP